MKEYKQIECARCGGHGLVQHPVKANPSPEECRDCNGSGRLVWYLGSGRLAQWPGGPFVGRIDPESQTE